MTIKNNIACQLIILFQLKTLRAIIIGGGLDYSDFTEELRDLEVALSNSIKDLRSQVCREGCVTVAFVLFFKFSMNQIYSFNILPKFLLACLIFRFETIETIFYSFYCEILETRMVNLVDSLMPTLIGLLQNSAKVNISPFNAFFVSMYGLINQNQKN